MTKFFVLMLMALLTPILAFALAALDLNSAPVEQLQNLPGVGKKTAEAIVAARPFTTVDQLKNVKGIGDSKFGKLKDLVMVAPQTAPTPTAQTSTSPVPTTATAATTKTMNTQMSLKPGEMINVNTAPLEDLEKLPGIGPAKAKAIMAARPFNTVDDLTKVKGIKQGTLAKIKAFVTTK